jgi:TRAP-type C4-dicarboxylate transport system permease small subunit
MKRFANTKFVDNKINIGYNKVGKRRGIYMSRYAALIIVLIPGMMAVWGIKWMRDTLFGVLQFPFPELWIQFFAGLISFLAGLAFVGGFIFYRDRKRNKVQLKFTKKK